MSAQRKHQRRIRKSRTTVLVVGEGRDEKIFLDIVKRVYLTPGSASLLSVRVRSAQGGGPSAVMNRAVRLSKESGFDRRVVLMDTDVPWPSTVFKSAEAHDITLVGAEPCLECLLLRILDNRYRPGRKKSKSHKRELYKRLGSEDIGMIGRQLSKEMIESARRRIDELETLLNAMMLCP